MSDYILFDTDILIDVGRQVPEAINRLTRNRMRSTIAISVITQMELIVGCRNKAELRSLGKFLEQFQIVEVNRTISNKAVELLHHYRLSHGLLIADSLIAATALVNEAPFISKNQKDYRFIDGLNLLPYLEGISS